ncbi:hypothetical protein HO133_007664 [Letharia lupina]|uniref:Ankyrin repeat protein n=1 Tax=Letharia lupina TaxID=560253 RepID=A0A8H6CRE3_9LECA|nr:uncharacterized protein HO133_007664 [Letharia lupina]KAF6227936.1 hypothetical protein HO133_007664 [Letharia lupina]
MLLSHTGDLKIKNDCTFAGLQQAAVVAKEAVVKMIPEGYVDPEVRCRYAAALLRKAASNPHTSALQLLLEHAHLAKASDKCTGIQNVLWAAASVNNEAATRLLLDAGADPNHQADKRKDPVMHCSIRNRRRRFGSLGVVEMLKIREATVQTRLEHGDSTEVPRNTTLYHHRGCTLLIVTACEDSCRRILQLLLDNGPNREANDTEGKTALYYAAGFGAIAHVRLLLERGAYPTSVNLATIELRREVDQDDYDEGIRLIRDARLEKKAESYTESEMENQVMEGQTESTEVVYSQTTTNLAQEMMTSLFL